MAFRHSEAGAILSVVQCKTWKFAEEIKIENHIYAVPEGNVAFYDEMKYQNPPNQQYFFQPGDIHGSNLANYEAFIINTHYLEAYRAYINGRGGIVFNNSFYTMKAHDQWRNRERLHSNEGKVIGHCHELIVLAYAGMTCFGHVLLDLFSPLLMLPKDVLSHASILGCGLKSIINEFLDLLEIPQSRRIFMDSKEYLAVDKIYTITDPQIYLSFFGVASMNLKKFFDEKYDLTKVVAKDYCLSNRDYHKPRYILNMDELFTEVKKSYPEYDWKFLNDTLCPTLALSAKAWCSTKFLYAPLGSNDIKAVFMRENTVLVTPYVKFDRAQSRFFTAIHIFSLQYKGLNSSHWEGPGGYVDIKQAIFMIEYGLYVLKNKNWPTTFLPRP